MLPDFIIDSELWGPLFALGVFVALLFVAGVANLVLRFITRRAQRRSSAGLAVAILGIVRGPLVLFLVVLGLFLGFLTLTGLTSPSFEVISTWDASVGKGWLVIIIVLITYVVSKLVDALISWYAHNMAVRTETDLDDKLMRPIKRVLPIIIFLIGGMIALDSAGISISPLLAGLGIAGLAVALAVQPTLNNFLSGTYIVAEGILKEGDYIELEGGPSGYVMEVGWRSTKLRSMMNNLVIIPNSRVVDSVIINLFGPTPAMNIIVYGGVSYDSDLAAVERIAVDASTQVVNESKYGVNEVEPFFGFEEFGESNVTFWIFVQATDRTGSFILTSELVKGIHARFRKEGIEINYPMRKLIYPSANGHIPKVPTPPPFVERPGGDAEGE